MEALAARLPFSLHALIAEAKRRARRRRFVASAVLLAVIATATGLTVDLSGGGPPSASQPIHGSRAAASRPAAPTSCHGCLPGTPAQQPMLDGAASDAQAIAGPYYTGAVVSDATTSVTVYLAHAPKSILDHLNRAQPGIYTIKNDAPRSSSALLKLMNSFSLKLSLKALKAEGITVSGMWPTQTGYLQVGVTDHVAEAQAKLDTKFGRGVIRVVRQGVATEIPRIFHGQRGMNAWRDALLGVLGIAGMLIAAVVVRRTRPRRSHR